MKTRDSHTRLLVHCVLAAICAAVLLAGCTGKIPRPAGSPAKFSGTLLDGDGRPLSGARVSVGDASTVTDAEGRFTLVGPAVASSRWVLDARKPGYAPVSKVLGQDSQDVKLTTVQATTQAFDPASTIVARATGTGCIGSPAADADWGAHPTARFAQVLDATGQRVLGPLPSGARRVLDLVSDDQPCATGFQLSIPAGALVATGGQRAQGRVEVDIASVDLYSADGMPGDYSVAFGGGPAYMESLGAGSVTVRDAEGSAQLAKGARAEVVIPVDRAQRDVGSKLPSSIPLLRYEPKTGEWLRIGEARLDDKLTAYVGVVDHLSEFNADVVKTDPACLRFDASGIAGSFEFVITAPTSTGGYRQVAHAVAPDPTQMNPNLHAVFNLPPNEWVVLRAIKSGVPVGTWIVETGAPWGSSGPPGYDYAACGTTFALSETVGAGVTRNGTGHRFGPLPKHVSFLVRNPGAGEDIYPVGGTGCSNCSYLFSLFDTGSNLVVLDNATTMRMGLSLTTPSAAWDVDVRLDGLGGVNASLNAPFQAPGTLNGAEAHSGELRIAPRNVTIAEEEPATGGGFVAVNYTLIGAPVANKVLARIDYTNPVTRGPWNFGIPFTITAPDIQFFDPGASGIPTPSLTLFVEGFGGATAATTGTTDQRHFLQNVTFANGGSTVFDDQTTASPVRFLYDSATTFTVISQAMATTLGTTPASPNPGAGCSSTNTANYVQLDSVTVVGMNASNQLASFTVNNAEVCVDVAGTVITTNYPDPANPAGPPRKVDAVIGANLFDQDDVLWNGPQRTLGILP